MDLKLLMYYVYIIIISFVDMHNDIIKAFKLIFYAVAIDYTTNLFNHRSMIRKY